ncbi:UNVERIFIED_CONTAM: DNA-directed DNA polymerase [Hammondia hammondi]|eukprot:XP_008884177.1 DNA-directed DNA polymerase [Hammondia hammondi]
MALLRREGVKGRRTKAKKKKKAGVAACDGKDGETLRRDTPSSNPGLHTDNHRGPFVEEGENAHADSASGSAVSAVSPSFQVPPSLACTSPLSSPASSFSVSPSAAERESPAPSPPVDGDRENFVGKRDEEFLGADGYFVEEDLEKTQKQLATNNKIRGLLQSFRSSASRRTTANSASSSASSASSSCCFFDDYPRAEEDEGEEGSGRRSASPGVSPSGDADAAVPDSCARSRKRGRGGGEEVDDVRQKTRKKGETGGLASCARDAEAWNGEGVREEETHAEKSERSRKREKSSSRHNGPTWLRADRSRDKLDFFHRLHEECVDFLEWIDATEEEQRSRAKVLARVTAVSRLLWPNCVVCPFGSSYTNLALPHADLDICIFVNSDPPLLEEFHELAAVDSAKKIAESAASAQAVSYGRFGALAEKVMAEASRCADTFGYGSAFRRKKEEDACHLRRLAAVLSACTISLPSKDAPSSSAANRRESPRRRESPLVRDLQLILEARVPICRFVDTETNLPVDISLDQPSAVLTSLYIRLQLLRFPLLRPLMLLNKTALKLWRLNEPFKGGVGSYLLFVMTLSFLQLNPRLYDRRMSQRYSLGHALFEFLHHYGVAFHYPTVGLSVRDKGRLFPKERRRWHYGQDRNWSEGGRQFAFSTEFDRFLLAAESPLESTRDIGRGAYQMPHVRSAWRSAYARMVSRLREETSPASRLSSTRDDSLLSALISPTVFADRPAPSQSPSDLSSPRGSASLSRKEAESEREEDEDASKRENRARDSEEEAVPVGPRKSQDLSFGPLPASSGFKSVCGLRAVRTQPRREDLETERRRLEACLLSSGTRGASGRVLVGERNRRGLKLLKKKLQQLEKEQRRLERGGRNCFGASGRARQNTHVFFEADSDAERNEDDSEDESEAESECELNSSNPVQEQAVLRSSSKHIVLEEDSRANSSNPAAPALVSLLSSSSSESGDDVPSVSARLGHASHRGSGGLRSAEASLAASDDTSASCSPRKQSRVENRSTTGLALPACRSRGGSSASSSDSSGSEAASEVPNVSGRAARAKCGASLRASRSRPATQSGGRESGPSGEPFSGTSHEAEAIVLSSSDASEADERREKFERRRSVSSARRGDAGSPTNRETFYGGGDERERTQGRRSDSAEETEEVEGEVRSDSEKEEPEMPASRALNAGAKVTIAEFRSFDLGSREAQETAGSVLTHLARRTAVGRGWEDGRSE